jgi:hypothetical protein
MSASEKQNPGRRVVSGALRARSLSTPIEPVTLPDVVKGAVDALSFPHEHRFENHHGVTVNRRPGSTAPTPFVT